jgi:hypothetical protein
MGVNPGPLWPVRNQIRALTGSEKPVGTRTRFQVVILKNPVIPGYPGPSLLIIKKKKYPLPFYDFTLRYTSHALPLLLFLSAAVTLPDFLSSFLLFICSSSSRWVFIFLRTKLTDLVISSLFLYKSGDFWSRRSKGSTEASGAKVRFGSFFRFALILHLNFWYALDFRDFIDFELLKLCSCCFG